MYVNSSLKTTQQFASTSHNKETFNTDSSFEERLLKNEEDIFPVGNISRIKTIKVQEEKCLEVVRTIKRREKMRIQVEKYLSKKVEEERRKVKIMIQVLNDIRKTFPYLAFYLHINNKNKI